MRVRGILFDKDGTLLDFHKTWIPAYITAADQVCEYAGCAGGSRDLLSSTGLDAASATLTPGSPLSCESNATIADLWSRRLGLGDAPTVLDILEAVFAERGAARAVPIPGLSGLLRRLSSRGLVLGVATMDSEVLARATLDRFDISHLFSFVCGYDSGHGEKPGPGMVDGFCQAATLEPRQCAVVGDTPHDLHMGMAAGVAVTVGVLSGAGDRETLSSLADHVLPDIHGLEKLLDDGL